jgi:3D (Asp-Asp-Asp) domain-containing protein
MIRLARRRPTRALTSFLYVLTSFTIVIFLTGSIDSAFAGDKPKSKDPQTTQSELDIPGSFKDLSADRDPVTEKRSPEEIASSIVNSSALKALDIDADKLASGEIKKVVTSIDKAGAKAGSKTMVSPNERAAVSNAPTIIIPNFAESELVEFAATAYCLKGRTASGIDTKPGMIAADPRVLPLGTVVHLRSGSYTGTYTVTDTGGRIRGRRVDVYVPTHREAMQFGRRQVKIKVLSRNGKGERTEKSAGKGLVASER